MLKTAFIIITSKCNRKCAYCFYQQEAFRRKKDKISLQKLLQIIQELKDNNFNEITFTGGEPLLKEECILKAVKKANQLGFITNLNTNGVLLNKNLVSKLRLRGLTRIYLSSQYLNDLPPNILSYIKHQLPLSIIHVITKENLKKIRKTIKQIERLTTELIIQPAYINKNYQFFKALSLQCLNIKQWEYLRENLKSWARKNKKEKYTKLIINYYTNKLSIKPINCHMGINDIIIDSDGDIFPCFHRQDLLVGNILKESLKDILLRMGSVAIQLKNAPCLGEHCLSLFYA